MSVNLNLRDQIPWKLLSQFILELIVYCSINFSDFHATYYAHTHTQKHKQGIATQAIPRQEFLFRDSLSLKTQHY